MATVGFSEAARLAGVSRQHLYRLAESGELKVITEILPGEVGKSRKTIELAELERVFGQVTVLDTEMQRDVTACDDSCDNPRDTDYKLMQIELEALRRLLQDREQQLQDARSREEWFKEQISQAQSLVNLLPKAPTAEPEEMASQLPNAPTEVPKDAEPEGAELEGYVSIEKYQHMMDTARRRIFKLREEKDHLINRSFLGRLFNHQSYPREEK